MKTDSRKAVKKLHARFKAMSVADRNALKETHTALYNTLYAAWMNVEGRKDFWFFLKNVLRNPVLYEPLHKPIADWLLDNNWKLQKKMLLMPRGHVKSNIVTVGYCLWRIVRDPNLRIILASHKDEDAEKFLGTVKWHIKHDDWFREVYPEIRPMPGVGVKPEKWSETQILVERDKAFVEPTVQCMSPGSAVTGRHYMLLIPDDIVTEKTVTNELALNKTKTFHALCESLLDPGAKELVIGTRYHYQDEYGRIIDTPDIARLYDIKVLRDTKTPGIINRYISGETKWDRSHDFDHLIYPSRFTLDIQDYVDPSGQEHLNRKSLPATRLLQGSLVYANQYQMEPIDPSTAKFLEKNIPIVDHIPANETFEVYQFLDMASEKKGTGSRTALVTAAVTPSCDAYIIDIFYGDHGQRAVTEELCRWQLRTDGFKPIRVGIEGGGYEIQLRAYIRERQKELGVFIPFAPLSGTQHNQRKEDHIESLCPYVEAQKIKILRSCRDRLQVIDEFIKYPKTKYRDCIDALAQIVKLVFPSRSTDFLAMSIPKKPQEPRTGPTFDEVLAEYERNEHAIGAHQVRRHPDTVRF